MKGPGNLYCLICAPGILNHGKSFGNFVLGNGEGNNRPGWAGGDVVSPGKGMNSMYILLPFPGACAAIMTHTYF